MKSLYLNNRFFTVIGINIFVFILGFSFRIAFNIAQLLLLVIGVLFFVELLLLYRSGGKSIKASRECAEKLSNGDENDIFIYVKNYYPFPVWLKFIDEIPFQFQVRNFLYQFSLTSQEEKKMKYVLRPVKRGEYMFGALNIFASTQIGFVGRRFKVDQDKMVAVYPSYLQMRKYELLAISNKLAEIGIKKIRKIGQSREFEQIKEYVQGDDVKAINWKATARKNALMVNHYQDEKSQQVYSIIDKGRTMRMPFEEMTLLDYAINTSLVISNIAIRKEDKAGLITYNHRIGSVLMADKRGGQMKKILELLYNQKTSFKEANLAQVYLTIRKNINQRSLIILYTNFESLSAMERQLPYLRKIAKNHLLVVIFFENTELHTLINKKVSNTEEIYLQTIAEKFAFEKRLIVKELQKYGIHAIFTAPQNLTVNTLNKYLEIKARGLL